VRDVGCEKQGTRGAARWSASFSQHKNTFLLLLPPFPAHLYRSAFRSPPASLSQLPELLTSRRPHLHIRDTVFPVLLPPGHHANLALNVPNNVPSVILVPDLALSEAIQLLLRHRVDIDGEGETDEESQQRHKHGNVPAVLVGCETAHGREEGTTGDGGHDEGRAAFGVFAETADAEGENERELLGLWLEKIVAA